MDCKQASNIMEKIMKNRILKFSTLTFFLLFFLASCKKETVEPQDNSPLAAARDASMAHTMMDVVEDEAIYRMSPATPISDCPRITWSEPWGTYPNTLIIDYGNTTAGCKGADGRNYSGQIKVYMSANYYDKGAMRIIRTGNLVIDGVAIQFAREITNAGLDKNANMFWKVESNGAQMWRDDASTTSVWSSSRVRTLEKGAETMDDTADDVFAITGQSKGTTPEGRAMYSHITHSLMKRVDCKWIVSGIEVFTLQGQDGDWKVNFGDGVCDAQATITSPEGEMEVIKLDGFWR
jgi:hypothetical protein